VIAPLARCAPVGRLVPELITISQVLAHFSMAQRCAILLLFPSLDLSDLRTRKVGIHGFRYPLKSGASRSRMIFVLPSFGLFSPNWHIGVDHEARS